MLHDRDKFRGYDEDGHVVVVGWVNADGSEYLVGLTKCCDATAKGSEHGIVCRACYGWCSPMLGAEATVARTKLTTDDLAEVLADERHNGWGYATANGLSHSRRERLDRSVVAVANELHLTPAELFDWANSKYGRHLVDSADVSTSRATVRRNLNSEAMQVLAEGR